MFKKIFGKKSDSKKSDETIEIPQAIISESMFSNVYNLKDFPEEILLRIHPKKKQNYDAIIKGQTIVKQNNQLIKIIDITIVLNDLESNDLVKLNYSTINNTVINHFEEEVKIDGFDKNGEPILFKMKDGTLRIVFSQLPKANCPGFDLNNFSNAFIDKVQCGISHDDREVFHVQNPNSETVNIIKEFLMNYEMSTE